MRVCRSTTTAFSALGGIRTRTPFLATSSQPVKSTYLYSITRAFQKQVGEEGVEPPQPFTASWTRQCHSVHPNSGK